MRSRAQRYLSDVVTYSVHRGTNVIIILDCRLETGAAVTPVSRVFSDLRFSLKP